ncbi:aspercryptin biosynthesis cluster-specific transcription regulator atnN [Colletotrichum spaethianum]|uniref:Aspercryptin biosynthesis cluster-specific transcription regulator atnN n=1 Tax=Colletotrichum spaethianum TaxID=700344 RepID=A0AA37LJH5_9PEZI|nr:aspercryptin biosynthesis cluster-specific transcription regulator atnN [Colletotrichum spaethianum]GKT47185.1 aspercryptin biosynthesis cluster-specific transcription regulator atnN [Colletotrichum spaethianum]
MNRARKVKCDEAKPHCLRCSSTGRVCDGYPPPAPPASAQLRPLKLRSLFLGVSKEESRTLHFFCEMVSPNLPCATDPYFWTHLVVQFSRYEPAVRHSIIAVSSLYEDVIRARDNPSGARADRIRNNELALRHYNAAIRELKGIQNQGLVLLVCLLFICIEFLQNNRETALRHCAHGVAILASSGSTSLRWVREYLAPIFRRLDTLSFFFGSNQAGAHGVSILRYPVPPVFKHQSEAEDMVEDILNQAMLLISHGHSFRIGNDHHQPIPPELLQEQERVLCLAKQWYDMFTDLEARSKVQKTSIARAHTLARYRISVIWATQAFAHTETGYDDYEDEFRKMVEETEEAAAMECTESLNARPSFEVGFLMPLFFCTHRCRVLDLRLKCLQLIKTLAAPRERIWNKDGMYALARRIIEIEHGLALMTRIGPVWEETRVQKFCLEFADGRRETYFGHDVHGSRVVLFTGSRGVKSYLRPEVLTDESAHLNPVGKSRTLLL